MKNLGNVAGIVRGYDPPLESDGVTEKRYVIWAKTLNTTPVSYTLMYYSVLKSGWFPLVGASEDDFNLIKYYTFNILNLSEIHSILDERGVSSLIELIDKKAGAEHTHQDLEDYINDLQSNLDSQVIVNEIQDERLVNLEGINHTWSPTNRTLTLFDNNGNQLSQVSLVSLDNEGTDLRYNATTLSLELYNADNELIDSIPVSDFVKNVGTQLQLNSNQLQLKDSQGNILSTVNFTISNIQGLQEALDSITNGLTASLANKADLVGGKVPKNQSQPSTMVMNNSTYVITFTDATGAIQTIDLPLESLFKDANYDETTKSLIVTLQDGTTRTIPLTDLVDLPEIVLATTNPAVTPTTGQKVWFNTSLGKVWFNVAGVWTYSGNLITDAEKIKLANTSGTNTGDETNTTIINKIGYTPENTLNKSSDVLTDKASSIKYPTVKSVYDYVQPELNKRLKSYAYDSLSAFPIGIQTDAFFIDRELGDVYIGWTDPNYFGDPGYGGTYYKKIGLDINTTDLVYYYKKTESDLRYIKIEANSSTGTVISFTLDKVYGTLATPETGNITADVTNAKLGVTNIIIHNSGTAPTFGSQFKKLSGSGNYVAGVVNYIYCTFISATEIIYSINQRA